MHAQVHPPGPTVAYSECPAGSVVLIVVVLLRLANEAIVVGVNWGVIVQIPEVTATPVADTPFGKVGKALGNRLVNVEVAILSVIALPWLEGAECDLVTVSVTDRVSEGVSVLVFFLDGEFSVPG